MAARTFTVASILILMAIASSEGATPVEAKVAPVEKATSIYRSTYEAPIETTQQEVEDGADDVFDMLLQVPQTSTKKDAKATSIYQSNYEAPIETTQQEVEDGADDVFDMLLQVEGSKYKSKAEKKEVFDLEGGLQDDHGKKAKKVSAPAPKKKAAPHKKSEPKKSEPKKSAHKKSAHKKSAAPAALRGHGGRPVEAKKFHGAGVKQVEEMLLQVPEKVKKAKLVEEKLAPSNGAGIYKTEYVEPPSAEETLDSMDSVFDSMVQVDATYEDSRPSPSGEEVEDQKWGHRVRHTKAAPKRHQHQRRQHHQRKQHHGAKPVRKQHHGAKPVKAKKFHGKGVKQAVLYSAGRPDDQEREPEDDSFDGDEPIGAGDGDFVEEDDHEFQQEHTRVRAPPAAVEVVTEDAPKKTAPKPVNIGLTEDKQATVALAAAHSKRPFSIPAQRHYGGGDNFEASQEGGNIVNPDINSMKRYENEQGKRRVQRRARANVYVAAFKKLEHGGDTEEDKIHRAKAMNRATEQLDEIQGINPLTGHLQTWMSKCSDGDEDC